MSILDTLARWWSALTRWHHESIREQIRRENLRNILDSNPAWHRGGWTDRQPW